MRPLTARQRQVLEFIRSFIKRNGYAPSHLEIGRAIGARSTNCVNDHIRRIEARGYLRRRCFASRAIVLTVPKLGNECAAQPSECTPIVSAFFCQQDSYV